MAPWCDSSWNTFRGDISKTPSEARILRSARHFMFSRHILLPEAKGFWQAGTYSAYQPKIAQVSAQDPRAVLAQPPPFFLSTGHSVL